MMGDERSKRTLLDRRRFRGALALGAAFACGCATGVDVTDDELEEICDTSGNRCGTGGVTVSGSGGSGSSLGGGSSGGTFSANGGRSTATGGTFPTASTGGNVSGISGSGGTGATTQPLPVGDCLPTNDLVILYRNRSDTASTQEPSMVLGVQNSAGESFDLTALAIRYWFTADGTSNFIPTIDYASIDRSAISVSFGQESGSDYAELTFTGGGSIGAEGVQELQLRFHADPYQPMNQANDFSFLAGATSTPLTANRNITPYLNGDQVGGCIPAQ
jgi:Cellulose binding domain